MSERPEPDYDFTFKGHVVTVENTKTFASGFQKRVIVIDSAKKDDKYKNPVSFTFTKDHCKDLDGIVEGMEVEVKGFFQGREWTDNRTNETRYFCDHVCYRTPRIISGVASKPAPAPAEPPQDVAQADPEDLPF